MKPSESESQSRVLEAFTAVEADIDQIRACRDSFTRSHYPSKSIALAHAMELACVAACTDALGDPSTAPRRMEEAIRTVWNSRTSVGWIFRAHTHREKAYLRHEWATLQWKAERTYEREVDQAKVQFKTFSEERWDAFRSMEARWKSAEQQFRKPVLDVYKSLLELSESPLPAEIPALSKQLNGKLTTLVVDALTHRKAVFLEQEGVQSLISDITTGMQQLPEQLWHRAEPAIAPPFSREAFHLRTHLDSIFTYRLFVTLRQLSEDMNVHFESLLRRAHELRDMVDVNLGLTMASEDEDRETLYRDGLSRAAQRLQELTEEYRKRLESTLEKAEESIEREFRLVDSCFETQMFAPLVAEQARLQRKDQAVTLWNRAVSLWSRGLDQFLIRYRHASTELADRTLTARRWLGYASQDAGAPVARSRASDYLNETERRLSQLPLIYRSLFSFDPVVDPRYLKGRDNDLSSLAQAYARWTDGLFTSVVLVGEEGSGKTSLLDRCLSTTLSDQRVLRMLIPHTITSDEHLLDVLRKGVDIPEADDFSTLLAMIRTQPRRYVVLEGMQNLYLRHMNGFGAIERFLLFITESASHVFWLVTCTRYSWNYLDNAILVSASFTDAVHTDQMDANEIRAAIMSRHRVSGYRAVFTPSDTEKRSRAYKKLLNDEEARQNFLELTYFQDLAKWSRGNIKIAMLFWLRTIRGITSDTFTIEPVSADLIEIGDAFNLDDLFAITAILQHQDITVDELMLNQNRSLTECRMTLTRLHARRILIEKEGRFSLNLVLMRPLTLRLQSKNILH